MATTAPVPQDYLFVTEQSQGLLKIIRQDSSEDIVSFTLGNVPYGIVMYDEDMQPGLIGNTLSLYFSSSLSSMLLLLVAVLGQTSGTYARCLMIMYDEDIQDISVVVVVDVVVVGSGVGPNVWNLCEMFYHVR